MIVNIRGRWPPCECMVDAVLCGAVVIFLVVGLYWLKYWLLSEGPIPGTPSKVEREREALVALRKKREQTGAERPLIPQPVKKEDEHLCSKCGSVMSEGFRPDDAICATCRASWWGDEVEGGSGSESSED